MTRSNAKSLVSLLSIVANSTRDEQLLFTSELKGIDLDFARDLQNAIQGLTLDINEYIEKTDFEQPYPMANDCFDRFGY